MTILLAFLLTMANPPETSVVSGMLGGPQSRAGKTNMYIMRPMAWRGRYIDLQWSPDLVDWTTLGVVKCGPGSAPEYFTIETGQQMGDVGFFRTLSECGDRPVIYNITIDGETVVDKPRRRFGGSR